MDQNIKINPTPPNARVAALRNILTSAISRSAPCESILLSGGLDTSIIAESGYQTLGLTVAITILCSPEATDRPHAAAIARALGLTHTIIEVDGPLALVHDTDLLDFAVRVLRTFDPMELRNSVVVARALLECHRMGLRSACTGDGADELFAGYGFMHGMPPEQLREYIRRMTKAWRFSAKNLGEALGIRVVQPFLDPEVVEFALECERDELIGTTLEGEKMGKWILRLAFPEVMSCWRKKEPIEVGAGTTVLPKLFAEQADPTKLEAEMRAIWEEDRVRIRDAEHLFYYKAFKRVFGEKGDCGIERWGSDPCKSCGYQFQSPEQTFCVVCGKWPARD